MLFIETSDLQIPLSDAMKAKARLTIGGGRDFDNGRVSGTDNPFTPLDPCYRSHAYLVTICTYVYSNELVESSWQRT